MNRAGDSRSGGANSGAARYLLAVTLAVTLAGCPWRPVRDVQIATTVDRPLDFHLIRLNSSGEESVIEGGAVDGITQFHAAISGNCTGDDDDDPDTLRLLDRQIGEVVAERDLTVRPICVEERLVYDGQMIRTIPGDIFDPWPEESRS